MRRFGNVSVLLVPWVYLLSMPTAHADAYSDWVSTSAAGLGPELTDGECSDDDWWEPDERQQAEDQAAERSITTEEMNAWFKACERVRAQLIASERDVPLSVALDILRAMSKADLNPVSSWIERDLTPYERRRSDLNRYEKDRAEAERLKISIEGLLAQQLSQRIAARKEQERLHEELLLRQQAEAVRRDKIILSVGAAISVLLLATIFKARRRISCATSRWWRGRSKAFRTWSFGTVFWVIGLLLFVLLADPYGEPLAEMDADDLAHFLGLMMTPPLFLGALWFGYKQFVR